MAGNEIECWPYDKVLRFVGGGGTFFGTPEGRTFYHRLDLIIHIDNEEIGNGER